MSRRDRPLYPIGTVARMVGVTPSTLRTWERRYGPVVPGREGSGRRLYSRTDVDRLRSVCRKIEEGLTVADRTG